jgi:hypothetical protein
MSEFKPGDTLLMEDEAHDCPFCGRKFHIAHDDSGPVGVVHQMPYCTEFVHSNGPTQFLKWVNDFNEQKG